MLGRSIFGLLVASALTWSGLDSAMHVPQVFRSDVSLTLVRAAVLDRGGKPVTALRAMDFRVLVEGTEKAVSLALAPERSGLNVALAVDFSSSVAKRWPEARATLLELLKSLGDKDCAYVLPFNARVDAGVWAPPRDLAIQRLLDGFEFDDGSRLYDALLRSVDELASHRADTQCPGLVDRGPRRTAVVVITDGRDEGSQATYADVVLTAWRAGIPVVSVALGDVGSKKAHSTFREQLAELSRVTNGRLFIESDLRDGHRAIQAFLQSYYVLGVVDERVGPRRWRDVRVDVPGRDVVVLAQPSLSWTDPAVAEATEAVGAAQRHYASGNYSAAVSLFEQAIELDPDWGSAHYGKGAALERLGQMETAVEAYRSALRVDARLTAAHARIAELSYLLRRSGDAWEHGVRARLAGIDMGGWLERLEEVDPPPFDLDARLRTSTVYVLYPSVADVSVLLRTEKLVRHIAERVAHSEVAANAQQRNRASFWIQPSYQDRQPDSGFEDATVDIELTLLSRGGQRLARRKATTRISLNDSEGLETIDEAIDHLLDWISDNVRPRRR